MTTIDEPVRETITRDDMLSSDPLLRLWLDRLPALSARAMSLLTLVILLPLAALGAASAHEARFFTRSLDCLPAAGTVLRGMSFLGDTMVWPFVFLVPLAFLLLSLTVNRFAALFRHPARFVSDTWLRDHPERYRAVLERTCRVFQETGAWRGARWFAVLLGALAFVFNLVICTWPGALPQIGPYRARADIALRPAASGAPPRACPAGLTVAARTVLGAVARELARQKEVAATAKPGEPGAGAAGAGTGKHADAASADEKAAAALAAHHEVPIPKWDTDPAGAPWSWAAARLWVLLFGYTWVPLLVFKTVNLVVGLYTYIHELTAEKALEVQPLSPDGAGGLSSLSATAYACLYPLLAVALMIGMALIKETASASAPDILLLVAFVPLFLSAFFTPLLSVHTAMQDCRDRYLAELSQLFNDLDRRLRAVLHAAAIDLDALTKLEAAASCVRKNFARGAKMPVWPFRLPRALSVLGGSAVAPLLKAVSSLIPHDRWPLGL